MPCRRKRLGDACQFPQSSAKSSETWLSETGAVKVFLASLVIAIALGVGAAFVLGSTQKLAFQAYSTQSARVGDPGHNLVGPSWSAASPQ
jgi:hypothetical protein